MPLTNRTGRAAGAALLAAALLGGCDFARSTGEDPNVIPDAALDQLFVASQVSAFAVSESQLSRLSAIWTQQMSGIAVQFSARDVYIFDAAEGEADWFVIYTTGGLPAIRRAIARAEAASRGPYAGILKIHEAFLAGTAAAWFGDVPYSQAGRDEFPVPRVDEQADVYAAVLARLDEAIADLSSTTAIQAGPGSADLNFGSSATPAQQYQRWIAVARTLKARYHLHMAEVGGMPRYQAALQAAQQGVQDPAGDWRGLHSPLPSEQNLWFMFTRDLPDFVVAGHHLVNLLNAGTPGDTGDDDPRLAIYFLPARGDYAGTFRGSRVGLSPGDPESSASPLRTSPGSPAGEASPFRMVSCSENAGIAAEAAYRLGDEPQARAWLAKLMQCEEERWGVTLPRFPGTLSGQALLETIMEQKYIALFLNQEAWNDYKRTCLPDLTPAQGKRIPGRLLYPPGERNSNPGLPAAEPERNDNDPNPCRMG